MRANCSGRCSMRRAQILPQQRIIGQPFCESKYRSSRSDLEIKLDRTNSGPAYVFLPTYTKIPSFDQWVGLKASAKTGGIWSGLICVCSRPEWNAQTRQPTNFRCRSSLNVRLSSSLFFQIESWRRRFVDDVSLLIAVGLLSQTHVGFRQILVLGTHPRASGELSPSVK
jgi:hypothetical protein